MTRRFPKTVLIVTDAWHPQINGVVRSIERVGEEMARRGIEVKLLTPLEFKTLPMPGYDEIRLSPDADAAGVHSRIEAAGADAIHIATEGPLGLMRAALVPAKQVPVLDRLSHAVPRVPAGAAAGAAATGATASCAGSTARRSYCLVGTPHLKTLLEARGFTNVAIWTKGVDTELFDPGQARPSCRSYPRPVFLYVGRVAVEKNIEAFLELDLPGTKLVVGGGPSLEKLQAELSRRHFHRPQAGRGAGADSLPSADVFVFPSRTDTFGLVLLEALASGTPVAAFPVTGPIDVIGDAPVGVLDQDLRAAALGALHDLPRRLPRPMPSASPGQASADQFLQYLPVIGG